MDFSLSDDQQAFVESARAFSQGVLQPLGLKFRRGIMVAGGQLVSPALGWVSGLRAG